ncbi:hypothetical protein [Natrinema sp. SYSU A 869]|uniref:hypothetical protein n=1 Tax=Natrinema sp. SYSU A 869 TaxID=2871694 RepID=UPI0021023D20|nr:hypothetical protein [Natrinema sp. SYSU A 869]
MSKKDVDFDTKISDLDASPPTGDHAAEGETDHLEQTARTELLEQENRRLRAEYARTHQAQYRRTAVGLASIGVFACLGAVLFPDSREVLFALAAVGLFGGVLTYYLTPGTFVAATVGERIYAAMAINEAVIADELGLSDERAYLPTGDAAGVRLYVPQRPTDEFPETLEGPIVTDPDHRGLALDPTGRTLFEEFERTLTDEIATAPEPLAAQLVDGLVTQFELAGGADSDVDTKTGRVTVAVDDSAFGDIDRFDHPVASFLAVGFATGLEQPIKLEVTSGDERSDWLITCRWSDNSGIDDESEEKTTDDGIRERTE